jgi:Pvc16 N-terminal domain
MSNHLAIATVTATLRELIRSAVTHVEGGVVVAGADVKNVRPDAQAALPDPGVNVFLYQVVPNPAWRNADLPSRRGDGSLSRRPQAALNLHYLLSFYGDDAEIVPQRLLGAVEAALHTQPVLTRERIEDTLGKALFTFLVRSDLAEAVELVKLTPLALSLDEMSKLWTMFPQTGYALSVAYEASVVLVERTESPQPALPVHARNLYVIPFDNPVIESAGIAGDAAAPLLRGSRLRIEGRHLRGDVTYVRVGAAEVRVTGDDLANDRIEITLDEPPLAAGELRAGVLPLQVVHRRLMGTPPVEHAGFESNVAPIVLRPIVQNTSVLPASVAPVALPRRLQVTADPAVQAGQRTLLLLNSVPGGPGTSYAIRPLDPDTLPPEFSLQGVTAGQYLVRLQVDGAESLLDLDAASPVVTV